MPHEKASHETTFGYLTTIHSAGHGYFGGYLILSLLGRPLEFHCTAPVRPSRAQEILYGPTLESYLLGEKISVALLGVAKLSPCLILTDHEVLMPESSRGEAPVVLLLGESCKKPAVTIELAPLADSADASTSCGSCGLACASRKNRGDITIGDYQVRLPHDCDSDHDVIGAALSELAEHVDLAEPFDRIHEAIREAQRIGGRATEVHDQAA